MINLSINNLEVSRFLGQPPLLIAAERGISSDISQLIQMGADVDCVDRNGNTFLHMAVKGRDKNVVVLALQHNVSSINKRNALYDTPLLIASTLGDLEVVEMLFNAGADPHISDGNAETPFKKAINGGHAAVVNFFLNRGIQSNFAHDQRYESLSIATDGGHENIVAILLEFGFEPTYKELSVLIRAAELGEEKIVTNLLKFRVDPNLKDFRGRTALMKASAVGCENIVDILSKNGADLMGLKKKSYGLKIQREEDTILISSILKRWSKQAGELRKQADALNAKILSDSYEKIQAERASKKLEMSQDICERALVHIREFYDSEIYYLCLQKETEKVEGIMVISADKTILGKRRYVSVELLMTNPKNIPHPSLPKMEKVRGAGSLLLKQAERIARVSHMSGVALIPVTEAMQFYYTFGFRAVSKQWRTDRDEFHMVKDLYRRPSQLKSLKSAAIGFPV